MERSFRLFCFGLGYTALALADELMGEGRRVAGTCRGTGKAEELRARGIDVFVFDGTASLASARTVLEGTTHVLVSTPPGPDGDPVLAFHAPEIAALTKRGLEWLGYLSTTGVYGDRGGGWVDETSPLAPSGERGRRRAAAESGWLELWRKHRVPVHVFRLAGIYGPGRNALRQVRAGTARRVHKPGQVFSRVHVADIAATLRASMARPNPGSVYNLCDDLAAPPDEVVAYACELLGVASPPLVSIADAALTPMARSFYEDNKRVRNDRIKAELAVRLKYPDYKAGLSALLAAGE